MQRQSNEPSMLEMFSIMPPAVDLEDVKALRDSLTAKLQEVDKALTYLQTLRMPVPGIDFEVPQAPTMGDILDNVRPLLPSLIPEIKDGKTPTKEELTALIQPLIPDPIPGTPGKDAKELKVEHVIDKIKKQKLQVEHINGLPEILDDVRRQTTKGYLHGGGVPSLSAGTGVTLTPKNDGGYTVSASGTTISSETPTGTVDGSNTIFTVLHTPLFVMIDGVIRVNGYGYTLAGLTINVDPLAPPVQVIRSFYNA